MHPFSCDLDPSSAATFENNQSHRTYLEQYNAAACCFPHLKRFICSHWVPSTAWFFLVRPQSSTAMLEIWLTVESHHVVAEQWLRGLAMHLVPFLTGLRFGWRSQSNDFEPLLYYERITRQQHCWSAKMLGQNMPTSETLAPWRRDFVEDEEEAWWRLPLSLESVCRLYSEANPLFDSSLSVPLRHLTLPVVQWIVCLRSQRAWQWPWSALERLELLVFPDDAAWIECKDESFLWDTLRRTVTPMFCKDELSLINRTVILSILTADSSVWTETVQLFRLHLRVLPSTIAGGCRFVFGGKHVQHWI